MENKLNHLKLLNPYMDYRLYSVLKCLDLLWPLMWHCENLPKQDLKEPQVSVPKSENILKVSRPSANGGDRCARHPLSRGSA